MTEGAGVRSAVLMGAAEALRKVIGSPLPPNELPRYTARVAAIHASLGDDATFDRAWQEGQAMTMEQAIAYALEEAKV